MIYTVFLTYTRPPAEAAVHLDAHKAWLAAHVRAGRILLAGPLDPPTGGLILAACADRAALDALMARDPFIAHGVAAYEAHACAPALVAADFPARWAPGAAAV
jgi:uncharacterized protein YciI